MTQSDIDQTSTVILNAKPFSAFRETKDKVKYLCKNSRYLEAQQEVEKYMDSNKLDDLSEKSKVYLRYILVLNKSYKLKELGSANVRLLQPALKQA